MYPSNSGGDAPIPPTPSASSLGCCQLSTCASPPEPGQRTAHPQFPRAGVDPITDPVTAFGVICTAVELPYRHQVVCLLLNHDHTGAGICVVHDTFDDQAPAEVVELLADHTNPEGRLGALAIASVRPGDDQVEGADIDMWELLDDICVTHEVTLLEWWIIGSEVLTPRRAAGDSSRWPSEQ